MPLFITQGRADRGAMNVHRGLAKVFVILVLGVASTFLVVSPLVAAPITYIQEATASGSLGGVAFNNADVLLSMTNDTDNVIRNGGIFSNLGIATVTVASGVPIAFAHSIEVFSNTTSPIGIAGFRDGGTIILDNAGIAPGYDLRTSIGPISGTFALGHSGPFATTIGDFILTTVNDFRATFTATVGIATVVPEPGSTLTLLGIGLAGLVIIRRRAASRKPS
jgi:hypothetical protein